MGALVKLPFYARITLIFVGVFTLVSMLYVAQHIVVPLIYATIIAVLLSPLADLFMKMRLGRILSITLTLLLAISFTFFIIAFLCAQAVRFSESLPTVIEKLHLLANQTIAWISETFHISTDKINTWLTDARAEMLDTGKAAIGQTLIYTGNALVILVLIPVYIFMILYYRPLLLEFIRRLFKTYRQEDVTDIMLSTKKIVRSYLIGILLEAFIIASLHTTSLLILGIDYALLLGVIGAILNIIPYVGGIMGATLPIILALTTKPSFSYAFMVLAAYMFIQFVDNHYIVPKVVASKVKVNALVSVIVVLAGSALWGIPGMLISIPLTAIFKVLCDHIEALKPWGFLIGDTVPASAQARFSFRRKIKQPDPGHTEKK